MSRIEAGGIDWYYERQGSGAPLLLVHGTGGSLHSWRRMVPRLAEDHEVLAIDLPGHGRSGPIKPPSLPRISAGLGALLEALAFEPRVVAGHSAGAAILLRMIADGLMKPAVVVSFNGAFLPFGGRWGPKFWTPIARALVRLGVPGLLARCWVSEKRVRRLVRQTGSTLDAEGVEAYRALLTQTSHVTGALEMMAHWDLRPLLADLDRVDVPVCLVAAAGDQTVPCRESAVVAERLPRARLVRWEGLGHLAHEEDPERATVQLREARRWEGEYAEMDTPDC